MKLFIATLFVGGGAVSPIPIGGADFGVIRGGVPAPGREVGAASGSPLDIRADTRKSGDQGLVPGAWPYQHIHRPKWPLGDMTNP